MWRKPRSTFRLFTSAWQPDVATQSGWNLIYTAIGNTMTSHPDLARPPLPPFTRETAVVKVRLAEDAWNSRDPARVAQAYTSDSHWRNRSEFVEGRDAIRKFLESKWEREQEYRLVKELWAFHENRIAVRFCYEWRNQQGQWFRSYGNENWEFDANGLMRLRLASINDLAITDTDRKLLWPTGRRPDGWPSLTDMGM